MSLEITSVPCILVSVEMCNKYNLNIFVYKKPFLNFAASFCAFTVKAARALRILEHRDINSLFIKSDPLRESLWDPLICEKLVS